MASPRWTIGARSDPREAVAYIAADSLTYATATARRLISAVERLDLSHLGDQPWNLE